MPINTKYGENNWGYCIETDNNTILYDVTVETFISNGKGGTNGPVLIKLIGDVESEYSILSQTG